MGLNSPVNETDCADKDDVQYDPGEGKSKGNVLPKLELRGLGHGGAGVREIRILCYNRSLRSVERANMLPGKEIARMMPEL